jgi:hypothetical protein
MSARKTPEDRARLVLRCNAQRILPLVAIAASMDCLLSSSSVSGNTPPYDALARSRSIWQYPRHDRHFFPRAITARSP